jgi:hypothetical protein
MMLKSTERNLCFLFSFVLLISVIWSLLNIILSPTSIMEPNTIDQLDKLELASLVVGLLFFIGYARYLLKTTLFLRKIFFYMGWWLLSLMGKELLAFIPNRTMRIFLVTCVLLFGLYLLSLAFLNLKKLLGERGKKDKP